MRVTVGLSPQKTPEVAIGYFLLIRKKDLKDPNINIPMAVRWLYRKKRLAEVKLGRAASAEEIILEYKGLLKSKSDEKKRALKNFKENYDRVILDCYRLTDYAGDIKEAHLFSMYVLDEDKTVLTVSQGNILGKENCFRRINRIAKILKSGSKIFIGGMGSLDKPREIQNRSYSFPGLGQFPENGRVLQFMTVWNDKGMCYNVYSGDQKPCSSDEFPIGK